MALFTEDDERVRYGKCSGIEAFLSDDKLKAMIADCWVEMALASAIPIARLLYGQMRLAYRNRSPIVRGVVEWRFDDGVETYTVEINRESIRSAVEDKLEGFLEGALFELTETCQSQAGVIILRLTATIKLT